MLSKFKLTAIVNKFFALSKTTFAKVAEKCLRNTCSTVLNVECITTTTGQGGRRTLKMVKTVVDLTKVIHFLR
jgi:hypothetical protein